MKLSEMTPVQIAFIIAWLAMAIVGTVLFQHGRDAKRKRRLFPWYIASCWLIVASYLCYYGRRFASLLLLLLLITLMFGRAIRATRFCDACGAMSVRGLLSNKNKPCSRCGATLDDAVMAGGPV